MPPPHELAQLRWKNIRYTKIILQHFWLQSVHVCMQCHKSLHSSIMCNLFFMFNIAVLSCCLKQDCDWLHWQLNIYLFENVLKDSVPLILCMPSTLLHIFMIYSIIQYPQALQRDFLGSFFETTSTFSCTTNLKLRS